jgi:hypothetical protein
VVSATSRPDWSGLPDLPDLADPAKQRTFAALADALIPAAHGMPGAGAIVDADRLRFVLTARPDLARPLSAVLAEPVLDDPQQRLHDLAGNQPDLLATLQLVVVAGYYSDLTVRNLIGYPGQTARPVQALDYPPYLAEGLLDGVIARGPIWRDPNDHRPEG